MTSNAGGRRGLETLLEAVRFTNPACAAELEDAAAGGFESGTEPEMTLQISIAEANKAVIRRLFEDAYNAGNDDLVDELVSPEFVHHGGMQDIRGVEGMKEEVRAVAGAIDGAGRRRITIDEMLADGDRVVTRYTLAGTHTGD